MLKITVMLAALALAPLAQAQAPAASQSSPAKKELVAKVLQLQQPGIEGMARAMVEQPARLLMQQAGGALQRMEPARRDALARDIEADVRKYVEDATPIVRDRAVKIAPSTIGALLEERFTEDELKQIITVLESPVNRKFQGMAGDMQKAIAEKLVADTRTDIEPLVRNLEQSVSRRLSAAPPAATGPRAPSASAPRAASAPRK